VHPYRWTPGGSPEYINKAALSEFIDFYKTFYVPNNATLSIAGDINVEETKKNDIFKEQLAKQKGYKFKKQEPSNEGSQNQNH
jgi:predicted Zn-dependent peptidase